jgi:tagatose 6-phosphate kinase
MIQCVGLNPVYQKTLTIENFSLNTVNRAQPNVIESSAGKGINVARVLNTLGQASVNTGFLGGDTGRAVERFLSQEGLAYDFVQTQNATRTCITILDPVQQTQTEIVEEGKPVSPDEVEAMYQVYEKNLQDCDMVLIAGTAPQNAPDDIYYTFADKARQRKIPVLIDTQKHLLVKSLKAKPFLVKINRDELGVAFQAPVDSDEMLKNLIQRVHLEGVEWVVISQGKEATVVSFQGEYWDVIPPSIDVVNPIGSGDATFAGIAATILETQDVLQSIRVGTACGTANALTLTPGEVRPEDVKRLTQEVRVKRHA